PPRGVGRRAGTGCGCARTDVRRRGGSDRRHRRGAGARVSTISRREARRAAVFMLFQWDVTGRPLGSLYEGDIDEYTRGLTRAVTERAAELDARITAASDDWTADRLGAVERNVLRVALEELGEGEAGSPERAIELLGELSELAKAVEEELTRAQQEADAQP